MTIQMDDLKPAAPWFGGKSQVADMVWDRLGDVPTYSEPFCGMAATLLRRPTWHKGGNEVIVDLNHYVVNFARAVQRDPEAVAYYAENMVSHADLIARHRWLTGVTWPNPVIPEQYNDNGQLAAAYLAGYNILQSPHDSFRFRMTNDPHYYDPKFAGWWIWGQSTWIGGGWCFLPFIEKRSAKSGKVDLSDKPPTVNVTGVKNQRPMIKRFNGVNAISRQRAGNIYEYMEVLSQRLSNVKTLCGSWEQGVTGGSTWHVTKVGPYGIFLDPPYGDVGRDEELYAAESLTVAAKVLDWCKQHGSDRRYRIALCGYDGEHNDLEAMGWDAYSWQASGGMGTRNQDYNNNKREKIWFSPGCLPATQLRLL